MNKKSKSGVIGTIIVIVILFLLVILTNVQNDKFFHIENIVNKIIIPIENGLTYLKNKIEGNDAFFTEIKNIKDENEELKQKNLELQQKNIEMELLKAENINLKQYMKLTEKYNEYEIVPGYIIYKDISNYSSNVIINIGINQGIKPNMVVVAEEGVVGHVISVSDNTSKIQLLTDTSSTISARSNNDIEAIVCRGSLGKINTLKGTYLESEEKVAIGDKVETTGLGGIYPKGLKIGEVTEIIDTKNISDRFILIKTYVDFTKLENIAVIKSNTIEV